MSTLLLRVTQPGYQEAQAIWNLLHPKIQETCCELLDLCSNQQKELRGDVQKLNYIMVYLKGILSGGSVTQTRRDTLLW